MGCIVDGEFDLITLTGAIGTLEQISKKRCLTFPAAEGDLCGMSPDHVVLYAEALLNNKPFLEALFNGLDKESCESARAALGVAQRKTKLLKQLWQVKE